MNIRSLGRRTDLMFARFSGKVSDRGNYTLVQTPDNPGYHWGNYIVFDHAPIKGSLQGWKALFDQEFPYYTEPHHYVFTWDMENNIPGDLKEFIDAGFEFSTATVLTAEKLNPPPHENYRLEIRKITTDQEWQDVTDLQTICTDQKFVNEYFHEFKKTQMGAYRKMSEKGMGHWFGAYLDETLVGDLGIFHEGGIGRYQNVGTHPDFRRMGICGTLVYQTGLMALKEYGVSCLVMEADVDYHAARIYESVGFKRKEINYAVSWWKGME
jgi:ribosomal protein S18 acetylase RimI-like enzyme